MQSEVQVPPHPCAPNESKNNFHRSWQQKLTSAAEKSRLHEANVYVPLGAGILSLLTLVGGGQNPLPALLAPAITFAYMRKAEASARKTEAEATAIEYRAKQEYEVSIKTAESHEAEAQSRREREALDANSSRQLEKLEVEARLQKEALDAEAQRKDNSLGDAAQRQKEALDGEARRERETLDAEAHRQLEKYEAEARKEQEATDSTVKILKTYPGTTKALGELIRDLPEGAILNFDDGITQFRNDASDGENSQHGPDKFPRIFKGGA